MDDVRTLNRQAAALLVQLISELANLGHDTTVYHPAVALACAALLGQRQEATDA